MSFSSSVGTQVAAIMDVLAKAAVAEITKLVDDGAVVLRLEMCQRDSEIQELKRSLKLMEVELCKAQEAAQTRASEDKQEQTEDQVPGKGKAIQRNWCQMTHEHPSLLSSNEDDRQTLNLFLSYSGEIEDQVTFAVYMVPETTDSVCMPEHGAEESHEMMPVVKQEPADEPATQETTDNTTAVNICFERDELIWPPPACSLFENGSVAMQETQMFSPHIEQYPENKNTTDAEEITDESLSVQIKEEMEIEDITENTTGVDICFEQEDPIWPPPACSVFEKSSVASQEQTQLFTPQIERYAAQRNTNNAERLTDKSLSVQMERQPMRRGRTTSEHLNTEHFRHALHPAVRQEQCLQPASQQVRLLLTSPHAQRQTSNRTGPNIEDHIRGRNSPRSKTLMNVSRTHQKQFTCSVCNRSFPRMSQLEEHKALHRPSKAFKCLECGKSFTQKRRLRTHQSVHTGERPYSCKICGKTFSRQDNCLRHERFHSGLKPHNCGQCGKSFTVLSNLKTHQETHLLGRWGSDSGALNDAF
ncbi:LOW QUALITY PROTEIN: uncharacterized protein LKV04_009410 [Tautogolabrus adspersus]